jgi:PadR family transcriptional regulator, regulatory protein PadR
LSFRERAPSAEPKKDGKDLRVSRHVDSASVARGRPSDVFGGEIRRRDVFPLLVLHLLSREPAYGNRLIEQIEGITDGVISVNPNTMYPLLRDLEGRGLVDSRWELPDRRTRRYYSITPAGRREYKRLRTEVEPFLDSVVRSVSQIKGEIYGE